MIKVWQGDTSHSIIIYSPAKMWSFIVSIVRNAIEANQKSEFCKSTNDLRAENGNSFKKAVVFCHNWSVLREKSTTVDTRVLVYS